MNNKRLILFVWGRKVKVAIGKEVIDDVKEWTCNMDIYSTFRAAYDRESCG